MTEFYDDQAGADNPQPTGISLNDMIAKRYSRRETMRSGVSAAALAVFGGSVLAACDDNDTNPPPNVTAGSSGASSAGRVVTLTGTATDNGTITSQSWVQVSGPTVSLSGASTGTATFIAPAVASDTPLVFRYAAADNEGITTVADTTVTVAPATLGFAAVAKNKLDVVTVPAGYTASVIYRTGDPIAAGVAAYKNDGTDTNFAQRAGDQHDALHYFPLAATGNGRDTSSSTRGLIVTNHENINSQYLHPNGQTDAGAGAVNPRPEAEAIKEIECHGVGIVEVSEGAGRVWTVKQDGALNRRITPNTPMEFHGPAAGSDFLKTPYSPTGVAGRGTINNCANGYTPWGTALTCEENWAGYFMRDNVGRSAREITAYSHYAGMGGANRWYTVVAATSGDTRFKRWDARITGATATDDWRNEPNQFGWVVEIDPYDATKAPRKRTALGRINHEGAWPGLFKAGVKPAWYTGDDQAGEYLYKFISNTAWVEADANNADRLAMGDKYLDAGTLYVAVFNADGTGTWVPLVYSPSFPARPAAGANPAYVFQNQADILVNARVAADAVNATPMDRPEWTAVNPANGEVYLTLTNNSSRTITTLNAANPRSYTDTRYNDAGTATGTSTGNPNGHVIRLRETGDTTEATTFTWDIYLFGANDETLANTNINVSGLDATNDFSSPDGLWFGRPSNESGKVTPLLWLQTDDSSFTDRTNNQMLVSLPGRVGDGAAVTISNTVGGVTATQATFAGKKLNTQLKRFLVGPIECEITGIDSTPDGRTIFVNVQHPGEGGGPNTPTSHWPDSQTVASPAATVRPRSATVVITKNDGGIVGY